MITVVGLDGAPLTERAAAALRDATLVVGGRRHLAAVPLPPSARTVALGPVGAALDAIEGHDGDAVVLASGDPGFFGILRALRERGLRPTVLPAVSSVAAAFARVGLPWDDALVVSAHGRDLRPALNACRAQPKVAFLTAPGAGPAEVAAALAGTTRRLVIAECLGSPDERVSEVRAGQPAPGPWREPNVVLALADPLPDSERGWCWPPASSPEEWALPECEFDHRDSMVTKAEVRALALGRLTPRLGTLVWDIGTGSGSVAVECARFGAAVVAVDRDPDQCERAAANARRHGVDVHVVPGAAPAVLEDLPNPDAVFVGGGGPDVVAASVARNPRRIVVALAALERVGPTHDVLASAGYVVDGVQLQASRLAALPGGAHRLAAENPVVLLWGRRS